MKEFVTDRYPRIGRLAPSTSSDTRGWSAGSAAGEKADLSTGRSTVSSPPRALGGA